MDWLHDMVRVKNVAESDRIWPAFLWKEPYIHAGNVIVNRISGFLVRLVLVAGIVVVGCGKDDGPADTLPDIIIPNYDNGAEVAGVDVIGADLVGIDIAGGDVAGEDLGGLDTRGNDTHVEDVTVTDLADQDISVSDTGNDVGPQCWTGESECNGTTTDRKTCDKAQVLSRVFLATDNGVTFGNPDTINESTGGNKNDDQLDDDGCPIFSEGDDLWCKNVCDDDGKDHFYQVYLMPGDYFSLNVSDYLIFQHPDYGYHIDFMLKVYKGQCPLNRDKLVSCTNAEDKSNSPTTNNIQITPMTEAEAGWYTIVVDTSDIEEAGTYTLTARLFKNSEYTGDWSVCCDYPSI